MALGAIDSQNVVAPSKIGLPTNFTHWAFHLKKKCSCLEDDLEFLKILGSDSYICFMSMFLNLVINKSY